MNGYYWTSTLFNTNSGYFVSLSYDDALVQEDTNGVHPDSRCAAVQD